MCNNFLKTLNEVKNIMGEEAVFKLLEGKSAIELFKLISKDKPVCKNSELSEKRRAAANARWKKYREGKKN